MEDVTSPFFILPLELREQIYGDVLATSASGAHLLRTCREINREARKYLYRRPLKFENQRDFYAWLEDTPSHLLDYVSELSLNLQDVDLRSILTSKPSAQKHRNLSPCLMTWELYQAELRRLEMSLKRLAKIKTVTIGAPSCQHSFLYRDFLTRFLEMLSLVYPDLCDLRLDGSFHHQELAFLKNLPELESLSFDGFSSSSPEAATEILLNLKSLKSLSLFSKHALVTPNLGVHSGHTAKQQSITGDVKRTIDQLASFTVSEGTTTTPALFFTDEVFVALQENQTLKSLSIQLSYGPDDLTFESLETFLDKSSIERLELDWPNLSPAVLEKYRLLSTTTKVLWVRATSDADAFEILWSVIECREDGDLRLLEKIVLIRSLETHHDPCTVPCDTKHIGVALSLELRSVSVSHPCHV
jgi:hypothetical protein